MSQTSNQCRTPQWRRLRQWWAQQLPLPCGRCGLPVHPGSDWHLDHMVPRWAGGSDDTARPSHAWCNISAGQDNPAKHRARRIGLIDRAIPTVSRSW